MTRSVAELTGVDQPAWPELREAIDRSDTPVTVLPTTRGQGERTLHRLQVTARSVLGALALECGGLLVDHGWLRVLGGGAHGIPDLAEANGLTEPDDSTPPPPFLIVAHDVLGGRFAVDGGGLGVAPGQVCHFATDSLRWEALGVGHGEFVHAMVSGATTQFYDGLRWPGWEDDCADLASSEGFSLFPPPFTKEGADPSTVSRRPVPVAKLFAFYDDAARQLDG
ncbi:DUF2625 family protein [Knoellia sp. LjRoot47]|uniref:DUF2625 family protein n=1 Tax=Knoellia sp. LjRoot47 TaxID=3342330 RepID=UPI003ECE0533